MGHVLVLALRVRADFGCVALVVVDALKTRRSFYEELGFEECDVALDARAWQGTFSMALPLNDVAAVLDPNESEPTGL